MLTATLQKPVSRSTATQKKRTTARSQRKHLSRAGQQIPALERKREPLEHFVILDKKVIFRTNVISDAMEQMVPGSILATAMISLDKSNEFHKGDAGAR